MTKSDDETKDQHACVMPPGALKAGKWSQAIEYCQENAEGLFYVGNDEYASFVNFCPFCGAKAPHEIPTKR